MTIHRNEDPNYTDGSAMIDFEKEVRNLLNECRGYGRLEIEVFIREWGRSIGERVEAQAVRKCGQEVHLHTFGTEWDDLGSEILNLPLLYARKDATK